MGDFLYTQLMIKLFLKRKKVLFHPPTIVEVRISTRNYKKSKTDKEGYLTIKTRQLWLFGWSQWWFCIFKKLK
jgi:hypothetical protein